MATAGKILHAAAVELRDRRLAPLFDDPNDIYRNNIQIGELNALNACLRHVLGSRDRVMIIRGGAGTGKTSLEQEIGEAMAEAGTPVVALAQSVKASRDVLRTEAGFANADTVARFLKDEDMQEALALLPETSLVPGGAVPEG